jgi:putative (di)nucleoside polyphosphate hydrolase
MSNNYRRCAGAIVFNKEGRVFLGKRIGVDGAWQFPQGGIEDGESIEKASQRELFEETGISSVTLIHSETTPIRYSFPKIIKENLAKKGRDFAGQDIFFSLFYFNGNDDEINLLADEQEFDEYKWESFDFAINNIIDFKKDVYVSIANKFAPLISQYLKHLT